MDWVQGEDMDLTPHLRGVLYLNNSAGLCARVDLLYLDRSGWKIDEKPGGKVCATDNSLDAFNVDLAPLTSDEVAMVTVKLQTLATDGNWRDVSDGDASQTVFIDE